MALSVPEFARLIKVDDVIRWGSGRGSRIRGERNRQIEMANCCGCCDRNGWIVKNALIKISNTRGAHYCFQVTEVEPDKNWWNPIRTDKSSMPRVGTRGGWNHFWEEEEDLRKNIGEISPYRSIDWLIDWLIDRMIDFNYLRIEINSILFIFWRGRRGSLFW
jgi:hypothetical protein